MTLANLDIRPLNPVIGAEIHNVDLTRLDDATFAAIRGALLEHLVIFMPGQDISAAEQLAFARRFGAIEDPHPVFDVVAEQPEVTVIEQDGSRDKIYNDVWHTDVTFREKPAMASILHARILPQGGGGDTAWASMYAAYDALAPGIKDLIEDLTAVHDFYMSFGASVLAGRGGIQKLSQDVLRYPPMPHPVVRCHPETGRKALFVNRTFTQRVEGLSPVESHHLLQMLFEHSEHPNFQMRHSWRKDDLVMWDNRCTMHLATSNFSGQRRMHRITVLGDRPVH